MFYLALRILGSQQDAEDAVQEALLRITEIIEKFMTRSVRKRRPWSV